MEWGGVVLVFISRESMTSTNPRFPKFLKFTESFPESCCCCCWWSETLARHLKTFKNKVENTLNSIIYIYAKLDVICDDDDDDGFAVIRYKEGMKTHHLKWPDFMWLWMEDDRSIHSFIHPLQCIPCVSWIFWWNSLLAVEKRERERLREGWKKEETGGLNCSTLPVACRCQSPWMPPWKPYPHGVSSSQRLSGHIIDINAIQRLFFIPSIRNRS